jgi:hypothetical protein
VSSLRFDVVRLEGAANSIAAKALECPAVFYIAEQMRAEGLG